MRFAFLFLFAVSASAQNLVIDSYKFAQSSTLNDNLIAYWKLGEASGTRVDSEPTGTPQNLTDNNTVTQVAGIVGNAAFFTSGNVEWLSVSDSADLSVGTEDFTIAAWVKLVNLTGDKIIASHWSTTPSQQRSWLLRLNSAVGKYEFAVSSDGTSATVTTLADINFATPPTNAWHFVVASHDAVNNQMKISTNDGTPVTLGYSAGVHDSTGDFDIGARGAGADPMWGAIDEVGFWKRILTAAEITALYNAGAGKTCCPFTP